jgi:Flp pilus assembly protein TadG
MRTYQVNQIMNKMRSTRNRQGSTMADTPIALWLLFLGLMFPLMDLASITMRYTFLLAAARDGAFAGSREQTFTLADAALKAKINQTAASFTGITVNNITTNVVTTNISSKAVTRQPTKLAAPANPTTNLYQIEAQVQGTIEPFINMGGITSIVPNVPGVTAPVTTSVTCREYFENPQGLNQ